MSHSSGSNIDPEKESFGYSRFKEPVKALAKDMPHLSRPVEENKSQPEKTKLLEANPSPEAQPVQESTTMK